VLLHGERFQYLQWVLIFSHSAHSRTFYRLNHHFTVNHETPEFFLYVYHDLNLKVGICCEFTVD
jgi:hypothetical protein